MKIDFSKTRENMAIYKIEAWARLHGFAGPTVRRILGGKYPTSAGDQYAKIISKLREEGLLVELPEEDVEEQAA